MMSRTVRAGNVLTNRASASRRIRRGSALNRLYCATNGCASFLEVDPNTGAATCSICGYVRRLH
ncbi:MAG TPA: hypothetical protein VNF73_14555 [Candidatus Saccharimonadales bacterium]|nr:hypothetical protein [Candidatus Saccharimonadales bacterium]